MNENFKNLFQELAADNNFEKYKEIQAAAGRICQILYLFDMNVRRARLSWLENQNQKLRIELENLSRINNEHRNTTKIH